MKMKFKNIIMTMAFLVDILNAESETDWVVDGEELQFQLKFSIN